MYCKSDALELENLSVYSRYWPELNVEPVASTDENGMIESIVNPKPTWLIVMSKIPEYEILTLTSNSA